jgi:hypothetical protein
MASHQPARLESESKHRESSGMQMGDARPHLQVVRPGDTKSGAPPENGSGRRVDIIIGIVLPILMLIFDPTVFRTGLFGAAALYGVFKPAAYFGTLCFVMLLGGWIKRQPWPAFMSGALAAAVVFSLVVGCAILPYSLFGILLLGLGLLGLTPFLMAYIYWRNARAAFRAARVSGMRARERFIAASGFILPLALMIGVQAGVMSLYNSCTVAIADGRPDAALRTLRVISRLVDIDDLMRDFMVENDPVRKKRIGDAFLQLTGEDPLTRYRTLD